VRYKLENDERYSSDRWASKIIELKKLLFTNSVPQIQQIEDAEKTKSGLQKWLLGFQMGMSNRSGIKIQVSDHILRLKTPRVINSRNPKAIEELSPFPS
jgi:hypothetical protein